MKRPSGAVAGEDDEHAQPSAKKTPKCQKPGQKEYGSSEKQPKPKRQLPSLSELKVLPQPCSQAIFATCEKLIKKFDRAGGVDNGFLASVVQKALQEQNLSLTSLASSNTLLHFARLHPKLCVLKSKAVGHQYTITVRADATGDQTHAALVKACIENIEHAAKGGGKAYMWVNDLERLVHDEWRDVCHACDCACTMAMFKLWLINNDYEGFWVSAHMDRDAVVGFRK